MADDGLVLIKTLFVWVSVLVGMLGVVMIAVAIFLYLIAAGEEPKMKKAHGMLWGGIGCLIGAFAMYAIGSIFNYS
ncbi:MAG: hypothetical protein FJZ04_00405 [Candidatus Moranbacteria bacterium]|nr:hypothetical protein [Candidatus Moranbacteria bacterium]